MKGKPIFLILLFCSFQVVEDRSSASILTPSLSERKTAKIRLDNGLEAYLISDPLTPQSAAALSVEAGSWDDPKSYPGMAHFLEHMLFMGSEAYPQENAYASFIHDNGGQENAFTLSDKTVYAFSIKNSALLGALDRFSHFFIDPLFSPSSIEREINAVDEEYAIHKEDPSWKKWMVLKETGNPKHPNAAFCIGNRQTLTGITQEDLKAWHSKHYSAQHMHLAVLSSLPMESLIEQVNALFLPISKKNKEPSLFAPEMFSSLQKGKMLYVDMPYRDGMLELIWEIPGSSSNEQEVSAMKLAALTLEHPLKNGLLQILKRKGLADDVSVFLEPVSKNDRLFAIQLSLSEKGVENVNEAILCCFQALARQKYMGIPHYIHDEVRHLDTLSYQYQSRDDAFNSVVFHASHLTNEALETYPDRLFLSEKHDPETAKNFLKKLSPENCLFILSTQAKTAGLQTDMTEKWTGTHYGLGKIDPSLLALWKKTLPHPAIDYPAPNPFLPHPELIQSGASAPISTLDEDHSLIYFQQDSTYLTPELAAVFTLHSPALDKTSQSETLLSLLIILLNKQLRATSYFASQADIDYQFSQKLGKLNISINGYSDTAPLLLKNVFTTLSTLQCNEEDFEESKQALLNALSEPYDLFTQTQTIVLSELFPGYPSNEDKLEVLDTLTLDDCNLFLQQVLQDHYIEGFFYGNLTKPDAKNLWQDIKKTLPSPTLSFYPHPEECPQISPDAMTIIEVPAEENSQGTYLSLHQGIFSPQNYSAQKILTLGMEETFFDTLRTKQQTGYKVLSWNMELQKHLFQSFFVQSSRYTPAHLLEQFEAFLENYAQHLSDNISLERFEILKGSVISELQNPPDSIAEQAHLFHQLATKREGNFHWIEEQIEALETLTYDEFLHFAKAALSEESSRIAVLAHREND
jgi:insulysin